MHRIVGAAVHDPVDEQGRGSVHLARGVATLDVPGDAFVHRLAAPIAVEALEFEREVAGVSMEVAIRERPLAVEEQFVHLPELPLKRRGLRRGGRGHGVRMDFAQGEMPKRKTQQIARATL